VLEKVERDKQIREVVLTGSETVFAAGADLKEMTTLAIVAMAAHVFCEPLTVESIAKAQENYQTLVINKGLAKYHIDKTDELFRGWSNNWLTADFMRWTIENYLPAIAVPLLVIQGYQYQYGTLKQVEAIKNQSDGEVEVVLLDDCRHSAYKEQQALTLDAIAGFVRRITTAEQV
jgi:pimeloyl-ACP methyl ester carboxylesterase